MDTLLTLPAADASLAEKTAFGVQELDQREPDWFKRVNTNTLGMGSHIRCILGQLYGDYDDGIKSYGWTCEDAALRGLYVSFGDWDHDIDEDYEELTDLWAAAINARLLVEEKV